MLVEERREWRKRFRQGAKPSSSVLTDYRKKRESELWRSSRQVEELCEYILYLEQRVWELEE